MDCREIRSVGTVHCWDGCYAEYMVMPERHVYHLPDTISMDEGALFEPGSIAYDAFRGMTLTKQDTVAVFGTGAIGMISVWIAKYIGAGQVILVGRTDEKLKTGKLLGADYLVNSRREDAVSRIQALTDGEGIGYAVETSGNPTALCQCILATKRYARISVVGFYEDNINIPMDNMVLGCKTLTGAAGRYGNMPAFCRMMQENPVKLTPVITHHVPFGRCLDVFENEKNYHNTKIKVMIDFA